MGFFSRFSRQKPDDDQAESAVDETLRDQIEAVSISLSQFNINDLLEDVAENISAVLEEKKLSLVFESDKDVPSTIIGDKVHLGMVLLYLLDNAIDFTDAGEVKLKIERQFSNLNEIRLRFKVIDSGVGIHPDAVKDVLNPFFRGEIGSLKELGVEGTGLFSAREILKKMKGKLSVNSQEGKGSTFIVDVSLFATDPQNKRHYRLPDEASRLLKIKIFDTDNTSAMALKKLFEYFRHDVSVPVLHHLSTLSNIHDYDLILTTDKLYNDKIADQIRMEKSKRDLKFVLISNRNTAANAMASISADGQLIKPYNQQMIFDLLVALSVENEENES